MDFRILGSLDVLDEGRAIKLGGSRQRALLTLLLLHANKTLTTDQLIDELWGERPPANAAKTVQMQISRLRRTLGGESDNGAGELIVTRGRGYELRLDPDQLDSYRFERLVAEGCGVLAAGDPKRAAARLQAALSLWRGGPLADLAYEPFAQREIARLDDLRVSALEALIEARLALGAHAEVVGQLETLIAEHPYRERLRALLMLALYRSERQADALQAYQQARKTLVEELGIEPGERLRALERAILAQDPELQLVTVEEPEAEEPAASEPATETSRSVLVGRTSEMAELLAGLDDAFAGRGRLFLLAGEAGIGKTHLAEALTDRARERGARVLFGRCWEAGGAPAYWPWAQALRAYIRDCEPADLRSRLGAGAADLAQIVPELRELAGDLPSPARLESEGARFRFFDTTVSFLRDAARDVPLVLVLDDLHAADAPSVLLLRFLAAELGASRILVLAAYRDVDLDPDGPLTPAIADLGREPAARRLDLTGLERQDVARFIELSSGLSPAAALVGAVHEHTEGNPLFVGEVVGMLASEGLLDAASDGPLLRFATIPRGAREAVGRRMRELPDECRRALALASVLGREFTLAALACAAHRSPGETLENLEEAIRRRIISEVPGAPGRLRFFHGLMRDALYEELAPTLRSAAHAAVGRALEELYAADPSPHLAELAHHFVEAGAAGEPSKALLYARRAAERAATQLAHEEAVRLYRVALALLEADRAADPDTRCELLLALGDAQTSAGDGASARETFLRAAEAAKAAGLSSALARAALGYGGRFVWARAGGDRRLVPLLEDALAALPDGDGILRARVLARLAGAPRDERDPAHRAALSEQAVEMARRIGDPATVAYALDSQHMAIWGPDTAEARLGIAFEMLQLAEGSREIVPQLLARLYAVYASLELGDLRSVKEGLAAAARLAGDLKQPSYWWKVRALDALLALVQGRFDEAKSLMEQAFAYGRGVAAWNAAFARALQRFELHRQQGRLGEVEEEIGRGARENPSYIVWRCALASLHAGLGREREARDAFEELAADGFSRLHRDDWLLCLTLLTETCVFLGDRARASQLYDLLLPYAHHNAFAPPEIITGSVSHFLGLLAATADSIETAERHFETALEMNGKMGARPWVAHTQREYAKALAARGGPGDRERALDLAGAALDGYRGLRMDAFADEVAELATALRAAPAR